MLKEKSKRYKNVRYKKKTYKKCLKASQIINIVNYLEKQEINTDSLKDDEKELIKIG